MITPVRVEMFEDRVWQMSLGERAAVEGVLAQLRPSLAIEIGSAEGACLQRIAAHSQDVHSFDLADPILPVPANVTLHTGNSHERLPEFLAELSAQERNVDFVIVDGDHSPEGVRQDLGDLLDAPCVASTVILIHDTANERVRRGIDTVRFAAWPKVAHVELDWIPGRLFAEPPLRNELWYGLGLVVIESARPAYLNGPVYEQRYHPSGPLLAHARELELRRGRVPGDGDGADPTAGLRKRLTEMTVELRNARVHDAELSIYETGLRAHEAEMQARQAELEAELDALRQHYEAAERALENIKTSASWKLTGPVRTAKRRISRAKG